MVYIKINNSCDDTSQLRVAFSYKIIPQDCVLHSKIPLVYVLNNSLHVHKTILQGLSVILKTSKKFCILGETT